MKDFLTVIGFFLLVIIGVSLEDILIDKIVLGLSITTLTQEILARTLAWVLFTLTITPLIIIFSLLVTLITRKFLSK